MKCAICQHPLQMVGGRAWINLHARRIWPLASPQPVCKECFFVGEGLRGLFRGIRRMLRGASWRGAS